MTPPPGQGNAASRWKPLPQANARPRASRGYFFAPSIMAGRRQSGWPAGQVVRRPHSPIFEQFLAVKPAGGLDFADLAEGRCGDDRLPRKGATPGDATAISVIGGVEGR